MLTKFYNGYERGDETAEESDIAIASENDGYGCDRCKCSHIAVAIIDTSSHEYTSLCLCATCLGQLQFAVIESNN